MRIPKNITTVTKPVMPHYTIALIFLNLFGLAIFGQSTGTLRGRVTLERAGTPLHHVSVSILQLNRTVQAGEDGTYEFQQVPPGKYDVVAHMDRFPDMVRTVEINADSPTTMDFQLRLAPLRQEITVTASGREQTTFAAFQAVTSLDSVELLERIHPSIGEVLDQQPGIAKRGFGPGPARPVIRGFDGDRVLILQDGIQTASVSSQSADHGEPFNILALDRLEVVKGPATLLYGGSAIGGVVNAVTGHQHLLGRPHKGLRGYATGIGGTNNAYGGGSAGLEYGAGPWLFWGNGGGQRTGDYHTPIGRMPNSKTRMGNGSGGFGWFGDKAFLSLSYGYDQGRYGIPFADRFHHAHGPQKLLVDLDMHQHNIRMNGGLRNLGWFVDGARLSLNYGNYQHSELENDEPATVFNNKQFIYRTTFDQRKTGPLSGSFGFWGMQRHYRVRGEEALSPAVDQNAFAVFTLQELDFERVRFQFGGRLEHNKYNPGFRPLPQNCPIGGCRRERPPARSFTGFSGAAGIHVPLWSGGAVVSNYTHSFRAPALEELYNQGLHVGNLAFEIGDPKLRRERGNGVDLSLRHTAERMRAEANFYYYRFSNFIFPAPTGTRIQRLPVVRNLQAGSRFMGTEVSCDLGVHPNLWLKLGLDAVDAELRSALPRIPAGTALPRIPPLRGRAGLEIRYKGLLVDPELIMAKDQNKLFLIRGTQTAAETRTAGYTVVNLRASYTIAQQHVAHIFSVNAFNLGDRLYRNHLSFIKALAPEIGRGVRFTYSVQFF